jgi:hypothetical protein
MEPRAEMPEIDTFDIDGFLISAHVIIKSRLLLTVTELRRGNMILKLTLHG